MRHRFRQENTPDEINTRFNAELQMQIDGKLSDRHIYQLGNPSDILKSAGIPNLPIELKASVLTIKSSEDYHNQHPFDLSEIKDLSFAIQSPLAVFDSKTVINNKVIMTELKHKGNNFVVVMKINTSPKGYRNNIEINDIRSIYPKDNTKDIINWINRGDLLVYADKNKILNWITQQQTNSAEVAIPIKDFKVATKILQNFENPIFNVKETNKLFREIDENEYQDKAKNHYDEQMSRNVIKGRLHWQDKMIGLKILQQAIELETGESIADFENMYEFENHIHSINTEEMRQFREIQLYKILESYASLIKDGNTKHDINTYIYAKHGIERNILMTWKADIRRKATTEYKNDASENKKSIDERVSELESKAKEAISLLTDDNYLKELENTLHKISPLKKVKDYSGLTELMGDEEHFNNLAREYVEYFETKNDTSELWKNMKEATNKTLKKTQESGIMPLSIYREVSTMYRNYIPLRGWDNNKAEDIYDYIQAESGSFNAPLKKTKGRTSLADDPIATISNMAQSAIMQGNKNQAKQRLLNLSQNHPTSLLSVNRAWYVFNEEKEQWVLSLPNFGENETEESVEAKREEHNQRMMDLQKEGIAIQSKKGLRLKGIHITSEQQQQHCITVKSAGIDYVIYINGNPVVAQAINGLFYEKNETKLQKISKRSVKLLAELSTSKNPEFILSNFFRDAGYANFNAYAKNGAQYGRKFTSNYATNTNILSLALNYRKGTLNDNNEQHRYFKEFVENGGRTGYAYIESVEKEKKKIEKIIKSLSKEDGDKIAQIGTLFTSFGELSGAIEDLARFTAYQTSRQMGKSILKSVTDAKEITVNFDRRGTQRGIAGFFVQNYMFFNAAIQGLDNFTRTISENRERALLSCAPPIIMGAIMPYLTQILIEMFGGDDDKDAYYELSDYERRNNLCIFTQGGWIKIPIAIELRALYALGDIATKAMSGRATYDNVALDITGTVAELLPLNPIGSDNWQSAITPSLFAPIVDLVVNKDFSGRDIMRKSDYNDLDPEWKRIYSSTNKPLITISREISRLSGGNDFKRGAIEMNPAAAEHLIESYLGGVGVFLNRSYKTISNPFTDDELQIRDIPIVNRIIRDRYNTSGGADLRKAYNHYLEEYKEWNHQRNGLKSSLNKGVFDYLDDYQKINTDKNAYKMQLFEQGYKQIKELQNIIKENNGSEITETLIEQVNQLKLDLIEQLEELGTINK